VKNERDVDTEIGTGPVPVERYLCADRAARLRWRRIPRRSSPRSRRRAGTNPERSR